MESGQERDKVSIAEASEVLGVAAHQIEAFATAGKLQLTDGSGKKSRAMVTVVSLKMFCDGFCSQYGIDRREPTPRISEEFEGFLPFPLIDTIGREEALEIVHTSPSRRVQRALENNSEEFQFDMYRLSESSPWRFSRSLLIAALKRIAKGSVRDGR